MADKLMTKMKTDLCTARRVTTTTDIWSAKLGINSFLGLTAHFVNSKERRRQSLKIGSSIFFFQNVLIFNDFLLACRRFDGAHTGLTIASKLYEILREYGLENKTFSCITDSASNMIKGSKTLYFMI